MDLRLLKIRSPVSILQKAWRILSPLPGGRKLFSRLLGQIVPYSGSVDPQILELAPGRARVAMLDRKATRNHLGSAHALAIANIGELACGLALNLGLPRGYSAILRRIDVEYLKKGRGLLVSQCQIDDLLFNGDRVVHCTSQITDAKGDLVARTNTEWKVGPLRERR
jgi:acyl-coenzyme A thioesterase PaaI-like protein